MSDTYRDAIARALGFPNTPRTLDDAVAAVLAVRDVELAAKDAEIERLRAEVRDLRNAYEVRHPEDQWRVTVDVPLHLDGDLQSSLLQAVSKAVDGWQPEDRDGWDAFVSGYPYSHSEEAERDRLRAELADITKTAWEDRESRIKEADQIRAELERERNPNVELSLANQSAFSASLAAVQARYADGFKLERDEARVELAATQKLVRDLRVQWQAAEERERVARREVKELRGAGDRAAEMVSLLKDLADPDDCQFDHHGGCQAHGYLSLELDEQCPVQEAKDLIESWRPTTEPAEAAKALCGCYSCQEPTFPRLIADDPDTKYQPHMIVCSECGNKRCPHATDHRNECTGSNEFGQVGSNYAAPYESCVLDSSGHCSRGSHNHDATPVEQDTPTRDADGWCTCAGHQELKRQNAEGGDRDCA